MAVERRLDGHERHADLHRAEHRVQPERRGQPAGARPGQGQRGDVPGQQG
jgi:hypothetical protein